MEIQSTFINIVNLAGILLGLTFLVTALHGSKSLQGSFFKDYYSFMVLGALLLTLGFLVKPIGDWVGLGDDTITSLRDVALLSESMLFVYASYILPRDARKYLESKGKHTA